MVKISSGGFSFFPSENFGSEKGFSHSASECVWICMRREKNEVNEFAFCWLVVNKQSFLLPSVHAHRAHAAAKVNPQFLRLCFWNVPYFTQTYTIGPHSFKALVTSSWSWLGRYITFKLEALEINALLSRETTAWWFWTSHVSSPNSILLPVVLALPTRGCCKTQTCVSLWMNGKVFVKLKRTL